MKSHECIVNSPVSFKEYGFAKHPGRFHDFGFL